MLPFQNMSGDPEQEYFADGMVEDIITALSRNERAVCNRSQFELLPTRVSHQTFVKSVAS